MKPYFLFAYLILLLPTQMLRAQEPGQTVRGILIDEDSELPLVGAAVMIRVNDAINQGAISDANGQFRIPDVAPGRVDLLAEMEGYELLVRPEIMVTAGKEVVLELRLRENIGSSALKDITITDQSTPGLPINEMATLSARSFSVEETQRYAAAIFDPARMAQNFAGVTGGGGDLSNEIVVRGNSPRGLLWRLEGVEIPNPNHFGNIGGTGGPISMLNPSVLGRSDFYTGAFPAEFGNAYSGVFDLNFRTGNSEQRESAFMIGVMGIEAATEGYFSKHSRASYLINYRYSTMALMRHVLPALGDQLPTYHDLSFKIQVPTAIGTFSLFGLGGQSQTTENTIADSSQWESRWDAYGLELQQEVGVVGLRHKLLLGERTYVNTVISASTDNYTDLTMQLLPDENYDARAVDRTRSLSSQYRIHPQVNHKFNARHTLRTGAILSLLDFDYFYESRWDTTDWTNHMNQRGEAIQGQAYAQWKYRFSEDWTLNAGFHGTWLGLNDTWAIDPRAALSWQVRPRHRLAVAVGIHSKPEHLTTYFLEDRSPDATAQFPNLDLEMLRAFHGVLGYDYSFGQNWRVKTELYWQELWNVPVSADPIRTFSIINTSDIWDIDGDPGFDSGGTGRNYGLDLTLEKAFSDQYYLLMTGSLYRSQYTPLNNQTYSTKTDGRFNLTMLGGREWTVGPKKRNIIGLNGKLLYTGGQRYTPIDRMASRQTGQAVYRFEQTFAKQAPAYWRADVGVRYTINRPSTTHSIMLDIQNLTNRQNVWSSYFDSETQEVAYYYQNGIFPILNYRIEF